MIRQKLFSPALDEKRHLRLKSCALGDDDDENHLDDGSAEEVVDDLQVCVSHSR